MRRPAAGAWIGPALLLVGLTLPGCADDPSGPGSWTTPLEYRGLIAEPAPGALRDPRHVDVGADGRVYVFDDWDNRIQVFDQDGTPGGRFSTGSLTDFVLVGDEIFKAQYDGVAVLSLDGTLLREFGQDDSGGIIRVYESAIAAAPDGTIYASGGNQGKIRHFARDGTLLGSFGQRGGGDAEYEEIGSLAVRPEGDVVALDSYRGRMLRYSPSGEFLGAWSTSLTVGDNFLNLASMLTIRPDGRIAMFGKDAHDQIWLVTLSVDGTPVEALPLSGALFGISLVGDLALAPGGDLILCSAWSHRLVSVSPAGGLRTEYGHVFGRSAGELINPTALAITPGNEVWVCDWEMRAIPQVAPDATLSRLIDCLEIPETASEACWRPLHIASAGDGGLFVAIDGPAFLEIERIDAAGRVIDHWQRHGEFDVVSMQAKGPDHLYVMTREECYSNDGCLRRIWQFGPGGVVEAVTPAHAVGQPVFDLPAYTAIALDPAGRLWGWNETGLRFDVFRPGLRFDHSVPGATSGPAPIRSVGVFAIDRNGDLFVDDSDRGRIVWLTAGGEFIDRIPYPAAANLSGSAMDFEFAPDGRLVVIKSREVLIFGAAAGGPAAGYPSRRRFSR